MISPLGAEFHVRNAAVKNEVGENRNSLINDLQVGTFPAPVGSGVCILWLDTKMNSATQTVPGSKSFENRVLGRLSTDYRKAHSPSLEGVEFTALCPVLASVSQTFSDLLIPICEYPALIQKELPGNSPAMDLTRQISEATDRLCEMNQHIIRLCQESNETPLDLDLGVLTREVLDDLVLQGKPSSSLRILLETDDHTARLNGPPGLLYHLVRDMCVHAFATMEDGGTLAIRVGAVNIQTGSVPHQLGVPACECCCIQFQDTTPAPRDASTSRFDPFSTSCPPNEYGLRLSSVYRSMLHFNGTILYKSSGAAGADYLLFFPKAASP